MSLSDPTVLLVPGAWHAEAHYQPLIAALHNSGFETHCPRLPTCNLDQTPKASLQDDTDVVSKLLNSLIDEGKSILVVMHSYGGAVGSNAISPALSAKERAGRELVGGIVGLVYMCAFMLQPGQTAADNIHYEHNPIQVAEDGTTDVENPGINFYNGVDDAQVNRSVDLLVRHNFNALLEKGTEAPWEYLNTTYLYCTEDKMLWYDWQRDMVEAAEEKQTTTISSVILKTGHSPFLSITEDVVQTIKRAWNASTTKKLPSSSQPR